jgi:putative DNA-invertase from lambdoid prophage Rac
MNPKLPIQTLRKIAVVGYCCSSGDEDGALAEQERRVKDFALAQGWLLTEIYIEQDIPGRIPFAERPQGKQLLAQLRPGDIVIGVEFDRVFCSANDAVTTILDFQKRRIGLSLLDLGAAVSSNYDLTKLLLTLLTACARFEDILHNLSFQHLRDAKRHQRQAGRYLGGEVPFGWRRNPQTRNELEPVPAEQDAIARMRQLRADGVGFRAIARLMSDRGFPIAHTTVRQVLARG